LVKVKWFINGSAHVEGTAELGDWKDGDEEYIPDPGHPPKDYGVIGDPFRKQSQSFHGFLPPVFLVLILHYIVGESLLQKILRSLCRKPLRSLSVSNTTLGHDMH
jgi:hypothetical protein